jgi:serine/threonine protein kinase
MRKSVIDLSGPVTLRSGLVANPTSKWDALSAGLDGLEPCEVIGEGKYGIVHKMMEKSTGQLRVVKTVERPSGWDDKQLKMEAEILQNLDHPHILRIFSWYEDGDAVNIVMEHCEGGELMKVVKEGRSRGQRLPEMWAATCIRQTFEALVYIHSKGIIHKDLKSANLLLLMCTESQGRVFGTPPHVVVCDLGLAEVCSRGGLFGVGNMQRRASRVAGTPVTMAPEVWKGCFGPKSDVWSMGCVMFEMMTGFIPFKPAKNDQVLWAEAHRRGPDWSMYDGSREAQQLNKKLLTVKESARPDAASVLEHEWIQKSHRQRLSKEELDNLVTAVREWKSSNPMQRALSLKMAAGCTCLKKFAALFSEFDTDNSGILDKEELIPALEKLGIEKKLAEEIAVSLDVNNDGSCEYLEFAAACLSSLEDEFDELLRQEFNVLDIERKAWLTNEQMNILIEELRPLADKHGLEMQEIDTDGDGVISFREFFEYFGRPGADVTSPKEAKPRLSGRIDPTTVKQLPMKQHIRIVREEAVESFIMSMQASIEASRTGKGSHEHSGSESYSRCPAELGSGSGSYMRRIDEEGQPKETETAATYVGPHDVLEPGQGKDEETVVDRILLRMQQHEASLRKEAKGIVEENPAIAEPTSAPDSPKRLPRSGSGGNKDDPQRSHGSDSFENGVDAGSTSSFYKSGVDAGSSSSVCKGTADTPEPTTKLKGGSGLQTALRTLVNDSLVNSTELSREILASHQSNKSETCQGCGLPERPMQWLGTRISLAMGLRCNNSNDRSPQSND